MSLSPLSLLLGLMVLPVTTQAVLNHMEIHESAGTCPNKEMRDAVVQNITSTIKASLRQKLNVSYVVNHNCGPGLWYRVAYLNMSDPSQQCPAAWRENIADGLRFCRRPQTSSGSCPGTYYTTGGQYNKVCGRATGYQIGSPDAFGYRAIGQQLDSHYVYGVSVTHGTPRKHIWTFAAGVSEGDYRYQRDNCPCSDPSNPGSQFSPSFVRDNYYCESGNAASTFTYDHLYSGDPLWDGEQCEGQCCSDGKSPPWFSVELPNPTTDDIEVRICIGEESKDDVVLQELEVYIQ